MRGYDDETELGMDRPLLLAPPDCALGWDVDVILIKALLPVAQRALQLALDAAAPGYIQGMEVACIERQREPGTLSIMAYVAWYTSGLSLPGMDSILDIGVPCPTCAGRGRLDATEGVDVPGWQPCRGCWASGRLAFDLDSLSINLEGRGT